MNYKEQLTEVLNGMPLNFSGKQFVNACREAGVKEDLIKRGVLTSFLQVNAEIIEGTRSWTKKIEVEIPDSTREQECIEFLKSKGYKISKLNWVEL